MLQTVSINFRRLIVMAYKLKYEARERAVTLSKHASKLSKFWRGNSLLNQLFYSATIKVCWPHRNNIHCLIMNVFSLNSPLQSLTFNSLIVFLRKAKTMEAIVLPFLSISKGTEEYVSLWQIDVLFLTQLFSSFRKKINKNRIEGLSISIFFQTFKYRLIFALATIYIDNLYMSHM